MTHLKESGTLTKNGGRWLIQAISPGQGSSGTYPQETLEAAARDRVFKAGTLMFADHATEAQDWERPEGSIKDLAGVLTEDARWDDNLGALVAEAKIFEHWRPILESMRDEIGISIRASGEVEEADGDRIVKRLVEGRSIDFVTRAGRGGRVLEVIESERPSTLNEIAEIFRPTEPTSAPAGEEPNPSDQKEAASMADTTNADASRVDEADSPEVTALKKRIAELEAELAAAKKAKAQEARRAEVTSIVEEAFEHISAPVAKADLIEKLTDSEADQDTLIAEAKKRADEYATATPGDGQVRGLGESRPVDTDTNLSEADKPKRTAEDIINALEGAA